MESEKLLEQLFDRKKLVILRYFLKFPTQEFYLREISKSTRISLATTFRIINKLLDLDLLKIHKIKKFKLYMWGDSDQAKYLQYILEQKKTVLDGFVEKAQAIRGIQMIILHGEATNEKASILIIGDDIDEESIRLLVVSAKAENNYTINYLSLHPAQFNQMSSMGLYPKKKVVLWEK